MSEEPLNMEGIENKLRERLPLLIPKTVGEFSYDENSPDEQTVIELEIESRTKIETLRFKMKNVTRDTTWKIYERLEGEEYSEIESETWEVGPKVLKIDGFVVDSDVKITFQCDGNGSEEVVVPYRIM